MRRTVFGLILALATSAAVPAAAATPVIPEGFKLNDKLYDKMKAAEGKAERACDLGSFVGHRGVLIGETAKAIGNLAKSLQNYEQQNPGAKDKRLAGNPDFFQQSLIDQINAHVRYLGELSAWQFQPPAACPGTTRTAQATPSGLSPRELKIVCNALSGLYATCPVERGNGNVVFGSPTVARLGGGLPPAADPWDTALRYAGEFAGFRLAVGPRVGTGDTSVSVSNRFDRKFAADAASSFTQDRSFTQFGVDVRLTYGFTPFLAVFGGGGAAFSGDGGFETAFDVVYAPGDTVRTRVKVNPNFATMHGGATLTLLQTPVAAVRVSGFGGVAFHDIAVSQAGDAGAPYSGLTQQTRSTPFYGTELDVAVPIPALFPSLPNRGTFNFVLGYRRIEGTTLSVRSETPFAVIDTSATVDDTDFFYGAIRTTFTF